MSTPDTRTVPLRVRLPFASEAELVERFGPNVTRAGVFIPTRAPKPEGTVLRFELVLADGTRVLRGEAVVARAEVGGARSGMTLRFVRLDEASRAWVERVVVARETEVAPAAVEIPVGDLEERSEEPQPPHPAPLPEGEGSGSRIRGVETAARMTRRPETEPVLGVDLGTSWARLAVFRNGEVELLTPADEEHPGIPSMVALGAGESVLVGEAAAALRSRFPERVASGVKRLLGRRVRSARMLEHALQSLTPVLADSRGHAALRLEAREVEAVELTAHVLRELASRASLQLGEPVRRAVLCVPAYFTDAQRGALLEAGRRAGLEVLRLLSEPTAAALAYGHGRALARKRLLVYDLGAGTFDVSAIEVTGDDVDVVSTGATTSWAESISTRAWTTSCVAGWRRRGSCLPSRSRPVDSGCEKRRSRQSAR